MLPHKVGLFSKGCKSMKAAEGGLATVVEEEDEGMVGPIPAAKRRKVCFQHILASEYYSHNLRYLSRNIFPSVHGW